MQAVNLYYRTTRKYRGGWSYLDGEEHIATGTILNCESGWEYDEGYDYYHASLDLVVPDSGLSEKIVCEAIRDTFRTDNCQHEYDCCGCLSAGVRRIEKLDDGMYHIEISGSRNY